MQTFPPLPLEIIRAIWEFMLPQDESEVCIVWPHHITGGLRAQEPLVVDITFPLLMHICHDARQLALSKVCFRWSSQAGCMVPYRQFRPDLDVLYMSTGNLNAVTRVPRPVIDTDVLTSVRHIAVEASLWATSLFWLPDFIFWTCQSLKSVVVVFPSTQHGKKCFNEDKFHAPARRCRLRKVGNPDKIQGSISWASTVRGRREVDCMQSMSEYVDSCWSNTVEHAGINWAVMANTFGTTDCFTGDAWDVESETFNDIDCEPYVFVQFKRGPHGQELWEEVCQDRMLPPTGYVPTGRIVKYRNPEAWRVNDDNDDIDI